MTSNLANYRNETNIANYRNEILKLPSVWRKEKHQFHGNFEIRQRKTSEKNLKARSQVVYGEIRVGTKRKCQTKTMRWHFRNVKFPTDGTTSNLWKPGRPTKLETFTLRPGIKKSSCSRRNMNWHVQKLSANLGCFKIISFPKQGTKSRIFRTKNPRQLKKVYWGPNWGD